MGANQVGIKAKCYRNTGTFGSPTWVETTLWRDLTMNQKPDTAEVKDRSTRANRKVPTTYDISANGTMRSDVDHADYLAYRTALLAGTPIDLLILTGAKDNNGEVGWRYEALVEDMSQDQGASNVMYDTLAVSPHGESTNPVQSVIVASGSPVFTTF